MSTVQVEAALASPGLPSTRSLHASAPDAPCSVPSPLLKHAAVVSSGVISKAQSTVFVIGAPLESNRQPWTSSVLFAVLVAVVFVVVVLHVVGAPACSGKLILAAAPPPTTAEETT